MKVSTLRNLNTLPSGYQHGTPFFVRIAGKETECKSLHSAQIASAYFPQSTTVTFSKTPKAPS